MKVISEISVVSTLQDYQRFYRADPYSVHPGKVRSIERVYDIAKSEGWDVKELNNIVTEPLFKASGIERNVDGDIIAVKPGALSDNFLIDLSKCARETEEEYIKAGMRQLQDKDIILLADAHAEGYIGHKTSIIRLQRDQKAMLLGHLIKVRPDTEKVNPYYLLAYLNSEPARHFLNYSVRGQTVGLHASDAGRLPVLLPPREVQDSIGNKLKQAIEAKIEAEEKRKETEKIFEKYFPNISLPIKEISSSHSIKDAKSVKRCDPWFFSIRFFYPIREMRKNFDKLGIKVIKLGDFLERPIFYPPQFQRNTKESEVIRVKMLSVGNLRSDIISYDNVKEFLIPIKEIEKYILHEGWILTARSGSIGLIGIVTNEGYCASEHLLRIVPKDIKEGYYIYAYLMTIYGKIQIIRTIYGAVVPEISPNFLEDVLIPIIPEKEEIIRNTEKYFHLHDLSKQLRSQAMEELNRFLGLNSGGDKLWRS